MILNFLDSQLTNEVKVSLTRLSRFTHKNLVISLLGWVTPRPYCGWKDHVNLKNLLIVKGIKLATFWLLVQRLSKLSTGPGPRHVVYLNICNKDKSKPEQNLHVSWESIPKTMSTQCKVILCSQSTIRTCVDGIKKTITWSHTRNRMQTPKIKLRRTSLFSLTFKSTSFYDMSFYRYKDFISTCEYKRNQFHMEPYIIFERNTLEFVGCFDNSCFHNSISILT
jgi:hypothetical protein